MTRAYLGLLLAGCLASTACGTSFVTRDATTYRDETRAVLASRNDAIRSCYDQVIAQNPGASGGVVVRFKVEAETGRITDVALDETATTAPGPLGACVVRALDGLALNPADAREGMATFRWDLRPSA